MKTTKLTGAYSKACLFCGLRITAASCHTDAPFWETLKPVERYSKSNTKHEKLMKDTRHISSHNLNVTCFSQMLFMPDMCVSLWETWPFIPYNPHGKPNFGNLFISTQVGNSGFWNLGFRFALFENVFPCPPRPPDVQLHTLMFCPCWGGVP